MTTIAEADIERILKVKAADLGLFVLAMHSLMERALKEKYQSKEDFGVLINRYTDDYGDTYGKPVYGEPHKYTFADNDRHNTWKSLCGLYTNHYLANDVRHEFAQKTEEEARTTVVCFLTFASAEGWTGLQTLVKLEKELDIWKKHDSWQSEELKRAITEIERLKRANSDLARKANELTDLQNKLATITARETALKTELAETEARLSKKDEKLDKIRQNANEQAQKFKKEKDEILTRLKDYDETKKYMAILERVSFYTKTRHDYEQSIISLSSEQADVLNQISLQKDFLIKGAAGTGKSLVLLKTLEKAVQSLKTELSFEGKAGSFRLLTYAKSLVKYNQYVTKLLKAEIPENAITTADSFLYAAMRKFFPVQSFYYNYKDAPQGVFEDGYFTAEEVFNEAHAFIWANCITHKQYVEDGCDRDGMKFPLKEADRVEMWNQIEEVETRLENQSKWPRNYAAKRVAERLAEGGPECEALMCEYSFVDEAQDLPPVILAVIKHLTKRAVFLAGDSDQSIYTKGFSWNRSGIDISGRTKILKTNFRNTVQIHDYAEAYRSTFKKKDRTTTPGAFRPGPPVEHITAKNSDDAMNRIIDQIKLLMNALGYSEENICIIANTGKKLEKLKTVIDKKLGLESNVIGDDFDFEKTGGIRLCTMQKCKGLDFPVVLFLADHRARGAEENSVYDEETFMTQQLNMVYVALSRAMEMLFVYTVEGSDFEPFKRLGD